MGRKREPCVFDTLCRRYLPNSSVWRCRRGVYRSIYLFMVVEPDNSSCHWVWKRDLGRLLDNRVWHMQRLAPGRISTSEWSSGWTGVDITYFELHRHVRTYRQQIIYTDVER